MTDVFVSYKAEDRRRVEPLVHAFESDGLSVWWDAQIGGGDRWRETIMNQLETARCVVVIWSKRSVGPEGEFVRDEASRAKRRNAYLPIQIDKVDPPLGFGETQALSLQGWKGDHHDPRYVAVLDAVHNRLGSSARVRRRRESRLVDRRAVIIGGGAAAVAIAAAGLWWRGKPSAADASIAVLPFANLSGDPAEAYFSDGIAEELRSALSRLPGVEVVGRTSSEAVRNDDAPTAARKLHVASILTGSVRQSPSTIRVTAELVDGRTGVERWSSDYDRSPGDAIKIQTDIAEQVANALSTALGAVGRNLITAGGTKIPQAQKLLLQALAVAQDGTKAGVERGISLLDEAIHLDPRYGDAYAYKARFVEDYADFFAVSSTELAAYRAQALAIAQIALRLAPNLPSARLAMAVILRSDLQLPAALKEYRRLLEVAPGNADVHQGSAYFIACLGRFDQALRFADKAVALDPLNPQTFLTRLLVLKYARRFSEAVAYGYQIERKFPEVNAWPHIGSALVASGKYDEARQVLAKAPEDDYLRMEVSAILLARTGEGRKVPAIVTKMHRLYGDALGYQLGEIYAQLGDKDRAFAALDHALTIRDSGLLLTKIDIWLDPLRNDPRFAALLRKLNFPSG